MFSIAGRAFTLRSRRPATWFTPVAVVLLALLANGTASTWQRNPQDVVWYFDIQILVVSVLATADCLERLVAVPPRAAYWGRMFTLTLCTLMLSSAFFGPFTLGIVRWSAVVVGVPWAVMLWLTLRELIRLLRDHAAPTNLASTASASR